MINGGLYVVTGEEFSSGRTYPEVIEACIRGGARIIQLREKTWPASRILEVGRYIRSVTLQNKVTFIVNDRVDLALALEADGIHVGQQDIPVQVVRKLVGPDMIVGASAGTTEEARKAERDGASYIGVGPVFPTETKKDARSPRGLDLLAEIKNSTKLPVYGIGGIKIENAGMVVRAGADGVAVVSAVVGADNIEEAARRFVEEIEKSK